MTVLPSKGFGSSAQAEDTNSVSVMTTDKSNANTFRMVLFLLLKLECSGTPCILCYTRIILKMEFFYRG